ncbi:class I SAM-dependent methyltransferase [Pontivivens insulae]|uniref:Uncharacterized protein n=1 Tax=Pontivivens insulae TaxID=1639689 RepID=A0A2R8AEF2_9RHOB|nr:SAM-dependent methyltransferase [Pontivivens insulae]RED14401.1 SAM-dependent MidA family methyltransferase [Pontivivens insulae]SPF30478.1 hypothetical protein POI8812_02816 [Pontivivens insulae]
MTALNTLILRQIAQRGPMNVAEYMTLCLQHPEHGYYTTRDPFGAAGDFITAPEIHQIFGEMIGLWLASVWMERIQGPVTLAEAGPGRGTLMADILRVADRVPGFAQARRIALIETSPTLRDVQRKTFPSGDVSWFDTIADLPDDRPLLFVANEFIDALPIRQFIRTGNRWAERVVGAQDGQLTFGLAPPVTMAVLDDLFPAPQDGALVEWCPAAEPILQDLQTRITGQGGAALLIDYGAWDGTGDTLQALKAQQPVDPLMHSGDADLTAHVNFSHLAAAAPALHAGFETQGVFLERLGITARAQQLAARDKGMAVAHRRLVHPDEMGGLFKVLGLSTGPAPLPGFTPLT